MLENAMAWAVLGGDLVAARALADRLLEVETLRGEVPSCLLGNGSHWWQCPTCQKEAPLRFVTPEYCHGSEERYDWNGEAVEAQCLPLDTFHVLCHWCETSIFHGDHRHLLASAGVSIAGDKRYHIWPYDEAPLLLQLISLNGGDEDWLALFPADIWSGGIPQWLSGREFGISSVSYYRLAGDWMVAIGAHA